VHCEESDGSNCRLRFEVEDTGPGISPELLPRLFQPFTQGDGGTTRNFGGTGLGLSISRRLALLLQGDIGVETHAGSGSRFWFTVKIGAMASSPGAPHEETPPSAGLVWAAEGHALAAEALRKTLEDAGIKARVFPDFTTLLDAGEEEKGAPPAAVLCAYRIGGEKGMNCLRRLRVRKGWEECRLYLLGPASLRQATRLRMAMSRERFSMRLSRA
jgi:two-component system sensor histidine kinase/response regulator